MIGLVYKDMMVMKKQLFYYLAFFVVYGFLSATGTFSLGTIQGAMVTMVGIMVPMSSMAYDEQAKWDKFAAATPVGRQGIVKGKYLLSLLTTGAAALISAALALLFLLTGLVEGDRAEVLFSILGCAVAAVFLNAVLLPILFKFGVEKSRILFLLLSALVFGGITLLAMVAKNGGDIGGVLNFADRLGPLASLLLVIAVAACALSYFISLGIMEKKEL